MHGGFASSRDAVVASLAGSYIHTLMPESGGCPASGTVAGVAVQCGGNMGDGLGLGIRAATSTVAGGAIGRGAAENSLRVAGLAARSDMTASEGEAGGGVVELDGARRAAFILGKAGPVAEPGHCNQHHEDLDRAAQYPTFSVHKSHPCKKYSSLFLDEKPYNRGGDYCQNTDL